MIDRDLRPIGKCYGSTAVGGHGQTVIPVEARRELDIDTGTKLLAFNFFQGRALLLVKADAIEEMITLITSRINEFEVIARQLGKTTAEKDGESS